MVENIYCRGKYWNVNDYNIRLSKENKITEDADKEIKDIKIKRDKAIDEVWK